MKIGHFVLNLTAVKFKIFFGKNQVKFCKKILPFRERVVSMFSYYIVILSLTAVKLKTIFGESQVTDC
jgi:hypothetical protein